MTRDGGKTATRETGPLADTAARGEKPPRIRAVIFDVGGTLLEDREYALWTDLARRVYLDLDPDALAHAYLEVEREVDARPLDLPHAAVYAEYWRQILSRASGRELERKVGQEFVDILHEEERPARLYSDARRCLDGLVRQHRRLAIVSNSTSEPSLRRTLDRVGIVDYFDPVLSSGTEGVMKPNAEIFRRAVRRLGVAPSEALYVGNLVHTDARGAAAAGLHSVWLNREGTGLGMDPPEITSLLEVRLVLRALERPDGRGAP
jgi:putative hydrolase of the HAD superfamily